jgi:hypothetical protein
MCWRRKRVLLPTNYRCEFLEKIQVALINLEFFLTTNTIALHRAVFYILSAKKSSTIMIIRNIITGATREIDTLPMAPF